jgi:hypothetical protein
MIILQLLMSTGHAWRAPLASTEQAHGLWLTEKQQHFLQVGARR